MATVTIPVITATQAQAEASHFLSERLPDRFTAGRPHFETEAGIWRVPVLLAYAVIGPVGQVGEVIVSAASEEILSATPTDEMMAAARVLYEQNRDAIEAPVP